MKSIFQRLSYHLLSSISLSFIIGIASTSFLQHLYLPPSCIAAVLAVLLILAVVLHLFKKPGPLLSLLLCLFCGIGFLHAQIQSVPPAGKNHVWNIISDKQESVIIGTLVSMPKYNGKTSKFTISTQYLRLRHWNQLTSVTGNILLNMEGPWPNHLLPGDTLIIRADLKRPTGFNSPGSFDFSQHLARQDIWITGFVRTPFFIKKLSRSNSFFHKLRFYPEKLRTAAGKKIDARMDSELSGLYRAILLGDRSGVNETVLEQFKASGVMHILAISGIHMSIIGALLFGLFYRLFSLSETLLLRFNVKKSAALFCLPVLILYSMIAGFNPPVVRSVIMSAVVIAGICIDKKKAVSELFFFAAFLILTFSPLQLFTASFQLSFTAVAAILFILPTLKKLLSRTVENGSDQTPFRKIINWILAGLLVSAVATLATTPLALYYFNRVSPIGPIANLFLEPLICLWSLCSGVVAIPFLFVSPSIGNFLLTIGGYGLSLALKAVGFFSSLPGSNFRLPTPSLLHIFLYYLFFMLLAFQARRKKWITSGGLCLCCIVISSLFYNPNIFTSTRDTRPFTITFLDVGQGSSTLIEYPSGYRILVDGGGSSYLTTTVGERVIAPYLWEKGISHIDEIIVTHPDADHYNGLPFITDHFTPTTVWLNSLVSKNHLFTQFQNHIAEKGIITYLATDGLKMRKCPEKLHCIANSSLWTESSITQGNRKGANNGLILQACANDFCLLLPGDISRQAERVLVEKKFPLSSDFLLSPHHGSATSNSEQFLQAVQPEFMVVSAGKNKSGTFPHSGLSDLCDLNDIKIMQTAQHGTIEITATTEGYRIYGYRKLKGNPLTRLSRFLIEERENTSP